MTRRAAITTGLVGVATLVETSEAEAAIAPAKEWRVYDGANTKSLSWRDMERGIGEADAVFVGEQHDDPETHRVELALLQALYARHKDRLTLAMEMFERDGQAALTDYVQGKNDEATLGKSVKLWPNYPTDYKPMVEFAKANKIPVVASNAPARIVRQVGQNGLSALSKLSEADKNLISPYILAPEGDEYARRFAAIIGEGHGDGKMAPDMVRRFYEAQCLRDDTMAYSVAQALADGRKVLHVNGAFHSDAGLGTVARLRWRKPIGASVRVVKVMATNGKPEPEKARGEADYLVYVPDKSDRKQSK